MYGHVHVHVDSTNSSAHSDNTRDENKHRQRTVLSKDASLSHAGASFDAAMLNATRPHLDTHTHTHTHTPQTSDLPIVETMIANSYVRHSNLCWDYTIQQLARLMN